MHLENRSGYDTGDLRAFFAKAFRVYGIRPGTHVIVVAAPQRSRGCAEVGRVVCSGQVRTRCRTSQGRRMVIAIAAPSYDSSYRAFLRRLAHLLRHECAHLRGMDHEDMDHDLLYSLGPIPAWARGARIRYRGRAPRQLKGLG